MSIEAMKQAIEALKGYRLETNEAAIKALRQAIEQAEKEKADFEDFVAKVQEVEKEACEIIRSSQEPVAYCAPEAIPRLKDAPSDWMVIYGRSQHPHKFPLYTAPPQREWVGLTDEEILEIDKGLDARSYSLFAYTRAIEAKLKEKNT
jgi:hypothetical protein